MCASKEIVRTLLLITVDTTFYAIRTLNPFVATTEIKYNSTLPRKTIAEDNLWPRRRSRRRSRHLRVSSYLQFPIIIITIIINGTISFDSKGGKEREKVEMVLPLNTHNNVSWPWPRLYCMKSYLSLSLLPSHRNLLCQLLGIPF